MKKIKETVREMPITCHPRHANTHPRPLLKREYTPLTMAEGKCKALVLAVKIMIHSFPFHIEEIFVVLQRLLLFLILVFFLHFLWKLLCQNNHKHKKYLLKQQNGICIGRKEDMKF